MASWCAASLGASMSFTFCSAGFRFAAVTPSNTAITRLKSCPVFSIATNVFSNVGGAGLSAIACISLRCCAMPASMAGW